MNNMVKINNHISDINKMIDGKEVARMKYKHEQFDFGYELSNFLNENNIKRENIISIYTCKYFHHLIYIIY